MDAAAGSVAGAATAGAVTLKVATAVEAIKKGASDYLNKPVSIQALRERIGGLLESARRRQRAAAGR